MGGTNTTSTTIVKNLPDYAQPYAQNMIVRSDAIAAVPYVPYTGLTFAVQNANEKSGIATLALRGRNGNVTIIKGVALIQDILNGIYLLGTDTFFRGTLVSFHDNLATAVANDVIPVLGGSKFAMGDMEMANLAQSLASSTVSKYSSRGQAKLYADNYKAARTDQHQALSVGLELASQPIRDAETLRGAGVFDREYRQEKDTTLFNLWVDAQIGQVTRLEVLGNAIRALVGAQVTKTEPFFRPSPVIGILGGAISGAAAGSMINTPYGTIAGAVVGAVIGAASNR